MRRAAVLYLLYAPPLLTFPYVVVALLMLAGKQSLRSTATVNIIRANECDRHVKREQAGNLQQPAA